MSKQRENQRTDLSEVIAENFGANATYVETLLARWQSDPALVDESWRAYFEELAASNGDATSGPPESRHPVSAKTSGGDGAAAGPAVEATRAAEPEPRSA